MSGRVGVYRRLLGYLRPYRKQMLLAYGAMMLATVMNLFVPQVIKLAIDQGLASGQASALVWSGGLIMLIAFVRMGMAFIHRYYGEWLTHRVAYDLRNAFYSAVQSLPFAFHDRAQTGDLMSRATSDITETERFAGIGLLELVATSLLLFGVLVAMFLENAVLASIVIGPMLVLVVIAIYFGNIIRPMFKLIQEQMGILASTMQESMTGIGVVKAFAREPHEYEKFEVENQEWFQRRYAAIKIWANFWPTFTLILMVAVLLLLWFGGPRAMREELSVGSLFAMISYVLMLNAPVSHLGFLVNMVATAGASANRVFEIMDTPNDVHDPDNPVVLENVKGEVRFEDVDFAYEGARATLADINFIAKPGEVVALIGPTGSGKSTITNLIPRFYDPTKGRVLLDGQDVRDVSLRELRLQIGIVLQAPFLFNATIADNIAYGAPDADMEQIESAARIAAAHEFIMTFPEGYKTMVGERGVTLSGGQKQRIAIARAVLSDPRILILDDSTSSVDTETEHEIQQALGTIMEGRTTIIIAQRLLTLKSADNILVLDEGRIVQQGKHDELLAQEGLYREIYDLQLRDQEEFSASQHAPSWMESETPVEERSETR
jgi:ATP-binding cassette, subfamily B, multidrug efflux pump